MNGVALPFIPNSIAEQWMLARDPEEINLVLEEIIDQYRSYAASKKSKLPVRDLLVLIEQVLGHISLPDDALKLNCLRLLRVLAEDHALIFVDVEFMVYSKLQELLQDRSRIVRNTALSLAASLSAAIPLYSIADSVLSLVESRPLYRECCIKVATVSGLCLIKQCGNINPPISDSHKRVLRAYIIRLANCAVLEFSGINNSQSSNGTPQDVQSLTHAAIDLLAVCCIAVSELDKISGSEYCSAISSPLPSLRAVLSSVAAFSAVANIELDNGVEREVCRRIKNFDFPSLAEETTFSVVKTLLAYIRNKVSMSGRATGAGSAASGPALISLSLESLNIKKVGSIEEDFSPRFNSSRPTAQVTPSSRRSVAGGVRKSLSNSSDPTSEDPPDTAPSSSGKFSPPKLTTAQSKSFNGSSPLSSSGKHAGSTGADVRRVAGATRKANNIPNNKTNSNPYFNPNANEGDYYQPSWSATSASSVDSHAPYDRVGNRSDDFVRNHPSEDWEGNSLLKEREQPDSFHSSLHSQSEYIGNRGSERASRSDSFHSAESSGRIKERHICVVRNGSDLFDGATTPLHGRSTEAQDEMNQSLRLVKPQSRYRGGEGGGVYASADNGSIDLLDHDNSVDAYNHRRGHQQQATDWPNSASSNSHTDRTGSATSVDEAESAGGLTERIHGSAGSQSFDSASRARLKRSRLRSANAHIKRVEEGSDAEEGGSVSVVGTPSRPGYVGSSAGYDGMAGGQGRSPFPRHSRALASMSDNGLERHLIRHDDRPVGGGMRQQGYFGSNAELEAMGAYSSTANTAAESVGPSTPDSAAPTPVRKPGRRSKLSITSSPSTHHGTHNAAGGGDGDYGSNNISLSDPVPLDLSDVTSLITKPDTTFDYIASEDLKPLTAPSQELSKAYKGLEIQEWPDIFHTLNTFRRLALHHPDVLLNSNLLHLIVKLMMKRVDELRSSLAKNAILTVEDFIKGLGRAMDVEVAAFLPLILKRSIDSSSFIAESADKVLQTMIDYITCSRTLSGLLLHVTHRSPAVRAKIAICFHALIHSRGEELSICKDFEAFKAALPKLLQDSAPESRAYSREVVRLLVHRGIASRPELETHISVDLLDKILSDSSSIVLSNTVSGRSTTAPGSADYGMASPMRSVGKRVGRNSTPSRGYNSNNSNNSNNIPPISPAGDRGGSGGGFWQGEYVNGCASASMETPTKKDRGPRMSQACLHATPSRGNNLPPALSDVSSDVEHHAPQRLRVSAEHLSAQLDAQIASPAPSPSNRRSKAGVSASASLGSKCGSTGSSGTGTGGSGGNCASLAVASAAKRAMEQDPELSNLQSILADTTVSSWTARKDAVDRVTELVIKHYDILRDANKLSGCVDCLLNRLEDGSVKVHMHVIGCLEKINEEEPLVLQHNLLQIVVPAVLGSAASTNKLISGKSVQMLRLLFDTLNPLQVAQYLCQTALHEKEKLRLTALKFLADVMPVFCADLDSIMAIAKKIIFPVLKKLLFTPTTKADVRVCAVECMRALQASLRAEKVWLWADDTAQQEEIKRITSSV